MNFKEKQTLWRRASRQLITVVCICFHVFFVPLATSPSEIGAVVRFFIRPFPSSGFQRSLRRNWALLPSLKRIQTEGSDVLLRIHCPESPRMAPKTGAHMKLRDFASRSPPQTTRRLQRVSFSFPPVLCEKGVKFDEGNIPWAPNKTRGSQGASNLQMNTSIYKTLSAWTKQLLKETRNVNHPVLVNQRWAGYSLIRKLSSVK